MLRRNVQRRLAIVVSGIHISSVTQQHLDYLKIIRPHRLVQRRHAKVVSGI